MHVKMENNTEVPSKLVLAINSGNAADAEVYKAVAHALNLAKNQITAITQNTLNTSIDELFEGKRKNNLYQAIKYIKPIEARKINKPLYNIANNINQLNKNEHDSAPANRNLFYEKNNFFVRPDKRKTEQKNVMTKPDQQNEKMYMQLSDDINKVSDYIRFISRGGSFNIEKNMDFNLKKSDKKIGIFAPINRFEKELGIPQRKVTTSQDVKNDNYKDKYNESIKLALRVVGRAKNRVKNEHLPEIVAFNKILKLDNPLEQARRVKEFLEIINEKDKIKQRDKFTQYQVKYEIKEAKNNPFKLK